MPLVTRLVRKFLMRVTLGQGLVCLMFLFSKPNVKTSNFQQILVQSWEIFQVNILKQATLQLGYCTDTDI